MFSALAWSCFSTLGHLNGSFLRAATNIPIICISFQCPSDTTVVNWCCINSIFLILIFLMLWHLRPR